MNLSVVIPVYAEEGIVDLLDDLLARPDADGSEFIVVDGAPGLDTLARISSPRVILRASPPGRAAQLNAGAAIARGETLLFLHADTVLPPGAFTLIRQALNDPSLAGGAFRLSFEEESPGLSFIAAAANLRSGRTRVPYGDQAIFVRRGVFQALGGFPPLSIMEDLEFMTRLRRAGHAIRILDAPVRTSARRQLREGLTRCTVRNLCIRLLYHCGVPARVLSFLYSRHGV